MKRPSAGLYLVAAGCGCSARDRFEAGQWLGSNAAELGPWMIAVAVAVPVGIVVLLIVRARARAKRLRELAGDP